MWLNIVKLRIYFKGHVKCCITGDQSFALCLFFWQKEYVKLVYLSTIINQITEHWVHWIATTKLDVFTICYPFLIDNLNTTEAKYVILANDYKSSKKDNLETHCIFKL